MSDHTWEKSPNQPKTLLCRASSVFLYFHKDHIRNTVSKEVSLLYRYSDHEESTNDGALANTLKESTRLALFLLFQESLRPEDLDALLPGKHVYQQLALVAQKPQLILHLLFFYRHQAKLQGMGRQGNRQGCTPRAPLDQVRGVRAASRSCGQAWPVPYHSS